MSDVYGAAGGRAEDIAQKIAEKSNLSMSRARVIARTEVSKASTALTTARAEELGSSGYIWRTARDGDTRPSHRAMEGQFVRWDKQVVLDGMTGHAGEFINCRCYPEPVVPREGGGVYRPPLPTAAEERLAGEQKLLSQWERQTESQVIPHVPDAPLVNVERARFSSRKLTDYSMNLNAVLADGTPNIKARSKAQRFIDLLGLHKEHAPLVEKQVMAWLPYLEAMPKNANDWGERFNVYAPVTGPDGRTIDVMTAWIYDRASDGKSISTIPRLINCFIDDNIDERGQYRAKK